MLGSLLRRASKRLLAAPADDVADYLRNGRRPWSRGYEAYKAQFLARTLADADLMARFRASEALPAAFGAFLDERVVEYPWVFSRLGTSVQPLLDAGSALNFETLLNLPVLRDRPLTLVTLAPEGQCHYRRGVSYHFADLRDLPFRDGYFGDVVCISTLEHVGMDNTRLYSRRVEHKEHARFDFLTAARELVRVCRPGGRILLTLPFGRAIDYGWYQQFDAALVDRLLDALGSTLVRETYFRYAEGGWQFSDRAACRDCVGFDIHATRHRDPASTRDYDPDFAAASRGIVALEVRKGGTP